MAYLTYFVVMACVILTVSSQAALEDVIELDEASWNARSPSAFYAVMFYETDCPFSAKFAPNWKEFAAEAPAELTVAAMECSDNKALCNQLGARRYPSVLFYRGDKTFRFPDMYEKNLDNLLLFFQNAKPSLLGIEQDL